MPTLLSTGTATVWMDSPEIPALDALVTAGLATCQANLASYTYRLEVNS